MCSAQSERCQTVAKARKFSLEPTWALEEQRLLELKRPQLQQKLKELDKNESELYGCQNDYHFHKRLNALQNRQINYLDPSKLRHLTLLRDVKI